MLQILISKFAYIFSFCKITETAMGLFFMHVCIKDVCQQIDYEKLKLMDSYMNQLMRNVFIKQHVNKQKEKYIRLSYLT